MNCYKSILLIYSTKIICLGRITKVHKLQRDICFRCENTNCLVYEENNAFYCNEEEEVPLKNFLFLWFATYCLG